MLVFLDTNIYIATKYVFDKQKFAILRSLMNKGKVSLLYTSVTEGEVLQHLTEDISGAVRAYNRALKKEAVFLLEHDDFGISKLDEEVAISEVTEKFKSFLALDEAHCLSLNPIDAEKLIKDYFEKRPPFEEKKPTEFKDALIVNSLKQFRETIDQEICIVSNDAGFRRAFEGDDRFAVFERIGDFLHYQQKQEEYYTALEEFVSDAVADGMFNDTITEYLENLDINRDYYGEWECDEHHIDDIECELSFIDITDSGAKAYIDVTVYVVAEIRHRDEDGSYYDREEGRYLFEKYVTATEKHRIHFEATIECTIEEEDANKEIVEFELIEDEKYPTLDLSEDTLTDYEEIDSDDEIEPEDVGIIFCSECGKMIGRESDAGGFDYEGNPLCEDCMTGNSKGEICPTCGKKYPSEMMISGFCENCFRNMD